MRQKNERHRDAANRTVKDIRRKTRKRYSSEDKIRIILAGLRGEESIAELCRQEGIAQTNYNNWSKKFMEAGRKRLAGYLDICTSALGPDADCRVMRIRSQKRTSNQFALKGAPGPLLTWIGSAANVRFLRSRPMINAIPEYLKTGQLLQCN